MLSYVMFTCTCKNMIIKVNTFRSKVHVDIRLDLFTSFINLQHCGHTALTFACLKENLTSISALLKLGANPNVCTEVCIESSMVAYYPQVKELEVKLPHVCEDTVKIYRCNIVQLP